MECEIAKKISQVNLACVSISLGGSQLFASVRSSHYYHTERKDGNQREGKSDSFFPLEDKKRGAQDRHSLALSRAAFMLQSPHRGDWQQAPNYFF